VVDDDDDPSSPNDVVTETPDSVLDRVPFSETPGTAVPGSASLGTVVAETPGFTSPGSVGPPAARGLSSAATAQKLSGKAFSLVAGFSFGNQEFTGLECFSLHYESYKERIAMQLLIL